MQGYDLCTGLGTPKVGLIYQISSPKPLTKNQPLDMVTFVIGTGEDISAATAVLAPAARGPAAPPTFCSLASTWRPDAA